MTEAYKWIVNIFQLNPVCFSCCCRMESTEKCEVVIQHFNGKYLKTPPGIPGESSPPLLYITLVSPTFFLSFLENHQLRNKELPF